MENNVNIKTITKESEEIKLCCLEEYPQAQIYCRLGAVILTVQANDVTK